jgi:Uma2 family endonuclease
MSLPETVEVHKLTVREFHALEPFLDPDRRHELLDGQILVMPTPGNPHSFVVFLLLQWFLARQRPGLHPWPGGLRLNEVTEVWPDLTLLNRPPRPGPDNPLCDEATLVVEVSRTTLSYDAGDKLRAYQQAGVPEYWIVDVQARHVLRYLAPGYQSRTFAGSGTPLSPQAYPDVSIDVGTLFAGS